MSGSGQTVRVVSNVTFKKKRFRRPRSISIPEVFECVSPSTDCGCSPINGCCAPVGLPECLYFYIDLFSVFQPLLQEGETTDGNFLYPLDRIPPNSRIKLTFQQGTTSNGGWAGCSDMYPHEYPGTYIDEFGVTQFTGLMVEGLIQFQIYYTCLPPSPFQPGGSQVTIYTKEFTIDGEILFPNAPPSYTFPLYREGSGAVVSCDPLLIEGQIFRDLPIPIYRTINGQLITTYRTVTFAVANFTIEQGEDCSDAIQTCNWIEGGSGSGGSGSGEGDCFEIGPPCCGEEACVPKTLYLSLSGKTGSFVDYWSIDPYILEATETEENYWEFSGWLDQPNSHSLNITLQCNGQSWLLNIQIGFIPSSAQCTWFREYVSYGVCDPFELSFEVVESSIGNHAFCPGQALFTFTA